MIVNINNIRLMRFLRFSNYLNVLFQISNTLIDHIWYTIYTYIIILYK